VVAWSQNIASDQSWNHSQATAGPLRSVRSHFLRLLHRGYLVYIYGLSPAIELACYFESDLLVTAVITTDSIEMGNPNFPQELLNMNIFERFVERSISALVSRRARRQYGSIDRRLWAGLEMHVPNDQNRTVPGESLWSCIQCIAQYRTLHVPLRNKGTEWQSPQMGNVYF